MLRVSTFKVHLNPLTSMGTKWFYQQRFQWQMGTLLMWVSGRTVGISAAVTQKNNIKHIIQFLQQIDKYSIHGEYKIWILVTSVLHFSFSC